MWKIGILEEDFEIAMTREVESEVPYMYNYSDEIWMKGIAEGEAGGLIKGRAGLIEELRKVGINVEAVIKEYANKA